MTEGNSNQVNEGSRPAVVPALLAVGAVITMVVACILPVRLETSARVRERACAIGPLDLKPFKQEQYHQLPYGPVDSCRLLDHRVPLVGEVDAVTYLLLQTEAGVVVVRVDYRDLDMGRRWNAHAVELSVEQAPRGMSGQDRRKHRQDVEDRGGVRAEVWTLVYGDG